MTTREILTKDYYFNFNLLAAFICLNLAVFAVIDDLAVFAVIDDLAVFADFKC